MRRRARSSGVAVTKIFTSASGAITVPMSRPSITAPGFDGGEVALQGDQRRAHLRDGGDDGGGLGHLVGLQVVLGKAGGIEGLRRGNRGRPVVRSLPASSITALPTPR